MRAVAILLFILIFACGVRAAGFDDPWSKGSGFDNPWDRQPSDNADKQKNRSETGKAKSVKKRQGKEQTAQPRTSFPVNPAQNPAPPAVPAKPAFPAPVVQPEKGKQGSESMPDASREEYNKPEVEQKKIITPFGHGVAEDMTDVRSAILSFGFTHGGKCGDGDIYFLEPALVCAAIAVRGGSNGLAGAATWVSSDCYDKSPVILDPYVAYAKQGKRYPNGWENNVNYKGFMSCVQKGGVSPIIDVKPFLGMIHPRMDSRMIDAILQEAGAKIVKKYKNGVQYSYLGSSIFCEYCLSDGRIIRLGLQVNTENPEMRKKIDEMDLLKSGARYGDMVVYFEKKDNMIYKIQWQCNDVEKNCGKNLG